LVRSLMHPRPQRPPSVRDMCATESEEESNRVLRMGTWTAPAPRHGRRALRQGADRRQRFVYVFDLGDDWAHLCTVGPERIDPVETLGILPDRPLPYWGWGDIPDQYRRRWDGDDGESPRPKDPTCTDLPPLRPGWGPEVRWGRP